MDSNDDNKWRVAGNAFKYMIEYNQVLSETKPSFS